MQALETILYKNNFRYFDKTAPLNEPVSCGNCLKKPVDYIRKSPQIRLNFEHLCWCCFEYRYKVPEPELEEIRDVVLWREPAAQNGKKANMVTGLNYLIGVHNTVKIPTDIMNIIFKYYCMVDNIWWDKAYKEAERTLGLKYIAAEIDDLQALRFYCYHDLRYNPKCWPDVNKVHRKIMKTNREERLRWSRNSGPQWRPKKK